MTVSIINRDINAEDENGVNGDHPCIDHPDWRSGYFYINYHAALILRFRTAPTAVPGRSTGSSRLPAAPRKSHLCTALARLMIPRTWEGFLYECSYRNGDIDDVEIGPALFALEQAPCSVVFFTDTTRC